jgi:hypothetical protein
MDLATLSLQQQMTLKIDEWDARMRNATSAKQMYRAAALTASLTNCKYDKR